MATKSVWDLPGGPWEKLFGGVWNNFNVAVYENPGKVLLTTVFPKSGDVGWIMIRVDKILLVPRGMERIEKQLTEKRLHILKQQLPDRSMTYLILLSPPSTVEFGSSEIGSIVFQKVLELDKEVEDIMRIAKKANVEVTDLKDASYKESASLFGNPTLLLSLLSVAPKGEEPKKEKLEEIIIGENEDGLFRINEGIFSSYSSIKKGNEEERNYLAQEILECAMIDALPIPLILDFSKHSIKLDSPNPYPYDYSRFGFENKPLSFKLNRYSTSESENRIRINLNQASPQFIWKIFGLGNDEASMLILSTAGKLQQAGKLDNISSIEQELRNSQTFDKEERAVSNRALRILRAIDKAYGDIFSGSFDMISLIYNWVKSNEALYISLHELDTRKRLAFMLSILESIRTVRQSSLLTEIEAKRAEHILLAVVGMDWFGKGAIQSEIVTGILEGYKGAIFVNEDDLPMEFESRVSYRFHIVAQGRAKFYSGGRGKEFNVRPLLSCPP